jgi:glycosyltransferase involved in cell wall biosynthesis
MHLLLIHQNFPGQFRDLGPAWLAAGHRLTSIGSTPAPGDETAWAGLEHLQYNWPEGHEPTPSERGLAVAQLCRHLQANGATPDVVISHSAWGEALNLAGLWPTTILVVLPELWGSERALGFGFDPALANTQTDPDLFDDANTITAQAIRQSHAALVACRSQRASFPASLRPKITVLPEGLPMERYGSNPQAKLQLGTHSYSAGAPLVTLVSRTLEPLRGLRQVVQAWPLVLEQRPDAQLLLVGDADSSGYGLETPQSGTHLEDSLNTLPPATDRSSIHVLGVLDHASMVTLLQCSACHLALSYPYTLSWSNLEALACGAPVVTNLGSALSYELNDGEQGLLCSFDDVRGLAELILELLNNTSLRRRLGAGGQSMVLQRFSQAACLQDFDDLLTRLTRVSNS